jgi:hypothetical protein
MEFNQEPNDQPTFEEAESEKISFKQWLQDNLRIIISTLIVVLIASGVYSYSKRVETIPANPEEENLATLTDEEISPTKETATEESSVEAVSGDKQNEEAISAIATSQETESSFIETAAAGDSRTTLARKALANYLEKNPDSALTPEHKIYIEDFLRKNITHDGGISIGTSVEFSKELVGNAIAKSKTLNDSQLQNLHKYALRVPSLL